MERVLVIDDSRSLAAVLEAQLRQKYLFDPIIASSYIGAKAALEESPEFIAAIVDYHLPDGPNGEAIDIVLEKNIPCIVFTSQVSESLREDILSKNIADYVIKQGQHNIDYVTYLVNRMHLNSQTKVLVVDDSSVARKHISKLLKIQCYQVMDVDSGEHALEVINEHPEITIAILDCFMDGMDGFELTSRIREKHSKEEMVIIGISSQGGQTISARFLKSGANDFLLKPFLPEELFCRVNSGSDMVEQFNKLKELNEQKNYFLGMAAHDIRGPIGVIMSTSKLILDNNFSRDRELILCDMIYNNSKDMLCLLNNLLDISAIESGKIKLHPSGYDFNEIVKERIELYRDHAINKSIMIELEVCQATHIISDVSRIKQLIDNFITNAIKYSPYNATIVVITDLYDDYIQFEVDDHGPGIKEEEIPLLFGAFQRLSSKVTGDEMSTGLGLAICKSIVDAHNGKIGYRPGKHGGSCFYFQLPITVE